MTKAIRFSSTGPEGWMQAKDVPLETAELIEGRPMGLDHAYLERSGSGLRAGIWRSGPYTESYESYPVDEFMFVLEGSVTLEGENSSETFRKGDAFLLPKGFKGTWRQTEPMVKYYVMVG